MGDIGISEVGVVDWDEGEEEREEADDGGVHAGLVLEAGNVVEDAGADDLEDADAEGGDGGLVGDADRVGDGGKGEGEGDGVGDPAEPGNAGSESEIEGGE